jgi:hypothetical protein
MNQNSLSAKRIVIVTVFGLLLLGTVVILLSLPSKNSPTTDDTSTSNSTKTTTTTTPISYTGFGELSQYGFSETQMSRLKNFLYGFNPKATQVVIDPATIKQVGIYDRDNPAPYLEFDFDMLINGSTYTAKLNKYNDFTNIRLILNDVTKKQVYDSGEPAVSSATDVGGD